MVVDSFAFPQRATKAHPFLEGHFEGLFGVTLTSKLFDQESHQGFSEGTLERGVHGKLCLTPSQKINSRAWPNASANMLCSHRRRNKKGQVRRARASSVDEGCKGNRCKAFSTISAVRSLPKRSVPPAGPSVPLMGLFELFDCRSRAGGFYLSGFRASLRT